MWEVRYEDGQTEVFDTAEEARDVAENCENASFYRVAVEASYFELLTSENEPWID